MSDGEPQRRPAKPPMTTKRTRCLSSARMAAIGSKGCDLIRRAAGALSRGCGPPRLPAAPVRRARGREVSESPCDRRPLRQSAPDRAGRRTRAGAARACPPGARSARIRCGRLPAAARLTAAPAPAATAPPSGGRSGSGPKRSTPRLYQFDID